MIENEREWTPLKELGRGGMATVYLIYDPVAEMNVAMKVLHEHFATDQAMVEAFARERQLMASLDHRGIAKIFESSTFEGRPAFTMEYLPGGDLQELLHLQGPLSESEVKALLETILEALAACHARGIIHRDIKPKNVLFTEDGEPKLVDFGIGQAEEVAATESSGQVGTVEYMAPERIDGYTIDGRSDLYSLSVLAFELLAGHVPYRGESAPAVLRMHRDAPIPDPAFFVPDLSPAMSALLMRGLAKEPEQRFAHADEMLDALRGKTSERVKISAHPDWSRLKDWRDGMQRFSCDSEDEGFEWVVYDLQPLTLGEDRYRAFRDLLLRFEPFAESTSSWKATNLLQHDFWNHQIYGRGFAMGLSREGAEHLVDELNKVDIQARSARRRRTGKARSPGVFMTPQTFTLSLRVSLVVIGLLIGFLGILLALSSPLVHFTTIIAALFVALFSLLMAADNTIMSLWFGQKSKIYHLDFQEPRTKQESSTAAFICIDDLALMERLYSPRIQASFELALQMGLHLYDRVKESEHLADLLQQRMDRLRSLAEKQAAIEEKLLRTRPGQVAAEIRRLDAQIEMEILAGKGDSPNLDAYAEEKDRLRVQLTERDAAQFELQRLAQQTHKEATTLEELTSRYWHEDSFDNVEELAQFQVELAP